jgi:peptidoglycan/LPS O-acetylase OafA/YrhL
MRRGFTWLVLAAAAVVVIGVFLQAFSISAYVRGAGDGALDMHQSVALIVMLGELVVVVGALAAWWGNWRAVGLTFAFLALSFLQLAFVGDTEKEGGWVNGLHGLLALAVLVAAGVYVHAAKRKLRLGSRREA